MIKYDFEFIDHNLVNKLFGILFLTFCILLIGSIYVTLKLLFFGPLIFVLCFLFSLAIPILIFQYRKKQIKQEGYALIDGTWTLFCLSLTQTKIYHRDIKEYSILHNNGAALNIKLKNKGKFVIASSNVYCKANEFVKFCDEFENTLKEFQNLNHTQIIKKKTFFERKWVYPFLVALTLAIAAIVTYALINAKQTPLFRLLAVIAPLMTLWGSYFNANRNK